MLSTMPLPPAVSPPSAPQPQTSPSVLQMPAFDPFHRKASPPRSWSTEPCVQTLDARSEDVADDEQMPAQPLLPARRERVSEDLVSVVTPPFLRPQLMSLCQSGHVPLISQHTSDGNLCSNWFHSWLPPVLQLLYLCRNSRYRWITPTTAKKQQDSDHDMQDQQSAVPADPDAPPVLLLTDGPIQTMVKSGSRSQSRIHSEVSEAFTVARPEQTATAPLQVIPPSTSQEESFSQRENLLFKKYLHRLHLTYVCDEQSPT